MVRQAQLAMRPLLPGLLTLLFFWQLGACPCGCPEHNAWVELFAGHGEVEPAAESRDSLVIPSLQRSSGHCVGLVTPPYIRSGRDLDTRLRAPQTLGPVKAWSSHGVSTLCPVEFSNRRADDLRQVGIPAQLERADLQVWRI